MLSQPLTSQQLSPRRSNPHYSEYYSSCSRFAEVRLLILCFFLFILTFWKDGHWYITCSQVVTSSPKSIHIWKNRHFLANLERPVSTLSGGEGGRRDRRSPTIFYHFFQDFSLMIGFRRKNDSLIYNALLPSEQFYASNIFRSSSPLSTI